MKATWTFTLAMVIVVFLAACVQPPPGGGDPVVIIPDTTKILDAEARAGLRDVDDQGTLRFSTESGVADFLAVDDVVVSEPAAAAPFGLLRKVTSVRVEGGDVIVETVGAELTEAIHQGSLSVSLDLGEDDLVRSTALHDGVTVQALDYVIDSDFGTNGAFRATGTLNVKPILDLDIDICIFCSTRLDLLFKIGLVETANLRIEASDAVAFDERYELASHEFATIRFYIGPVPVSLTPRMELYLTASGTVTGEVLFVAEQDLTLVAGFTYQSGKGFRNLSQNTGSFDRGAAVFQGSMAAGAAVGARFELYLYDAVGPYGAIEAGPRIDASQSGLTGSSATLWELSGCVRGLIGLDSIKGLGLEYESTLFGRCTVFARETNDPPSVFIRSPTEGTQIFEGDVVTLRGDAFDPNGHTVTCVWTSSRAGDPFPASGCSTQVSFATAGTRTLTFVGTDPAGMSASDTVTIQVATAPLILVTVTNPVDQQHLAASEAILLSGSASGGLAPYAYQWSIAYPTNASGAGGEIFEIGPGASRTWIPDQLLDVDDCWMSTAKMMLDVTDTNGFVGTRSVLIKFGTIC